MTFKHVSFDFKSYLWALLHGCIFAFSNGSQMVVCCMFVTCLLHLLHFGYIECICCRVGHLQVWRLGRLGSLQRRKSAEDQKGFGDDDDQHDDDNSDDQLPW